MTFRNESQKQFAFLVELIYGDPIENTYYTDWTTEILYDSKTYTSKPSLEISFPQNDGLVRDSKGKINLLEDDFLITLSDGSPHAPVEIKIYEIFGLDMPMSTWEVNLEYWGDFDLISSNFQGKKGSVYVETVSEKEYMDQFLGFSALRHCGWGFCSKGCNLDRDRFTETGTLSAINGKEVTITGIPAAPDSTYYQFGWVSYKGLDLKIRIWSSGDATKFELVKEPPASWLSQTVTVTSGCDKLETTCDSRYGNLLQWSGIGFEMPDRNAILEQ